MLSKTQPLTPPHATLAPPTRLNSADSPLCRSYVCSTCASDGSTPFQRFQWRASTLQRSPACVFPMLLSRLYMLSPLTPLSTGLLCSLCFVAFFRVAIHSPEPRASSRAHRCPAMVFTPVDVPFILAHALLTAFCRSSPPLHTSHFISFSSITLAPAALTRRA